MFCRRSVPRLSARTSQQDNSVMIVCTNRAWSQTPLVDTQHRAAVSLAPRVSSGYTRRPIPCSLCSRPLALVRGRAESSQHAETLLRSSRILLLLAVCVRVCRRIPVGCLVAVHTAKKNQQAGRRAVCGGGRCCHCVASSTAGRRKLHFPRRPRPAHPLTTRAKDRHFED